MFVSKLKLAGAITMNIESQTNSQAITRINAQPTAKHAIVIGASIAGLLAARILHDHFDLVTIIERDQLPQGADYRKGVPQAHHTHVLMMRGQQILERLFPGFSNDLDAYGAPRMQWLTDVNLYYGGGPVQQFDLGIETRNTSRPTLEWIVRQYLMAYDNVQFLSNAQVDNLLTDESKQRLTGVQITYRRGSDQGSGTESIRADFVIDAGGRGSRTPQWFTALGYEAPQETIVNPHLGYASRVYKRLSKPVKWKLMGYNPQPPNNPEGGSITLQENGQWIVTLAGFAKRFPPTDEAGFLAFARDLRLPVIYDAIKDGEPLTDIHGYQNTQNCMHHYERLTRMPKRFVVVGDAFCCFNPLYGHGMTVSAMGAELLDEFLRAQPNLETGLDNIGQNFQKKLAKLISIPWLMATGTDFQYPTTDGKRPGKITQVAQSYLERLVNQMPYNPVVAKAFIEVMNLVKPPTSLFHPRLIMMVARTGRNPKPQSTAGIAPTAAEI
jgi:2-polyprenyl-6-methoxyphenol hydroxylase-like FAD-dependent oxidoreductase